MVKYERIHIWSINAALYFFLVWFVQMSFVIFECKRMSFVVLYFWCRLCADYCFDFYVIIIVNKILITWVHLSISDSQYLMLNFRSLGDPKRLRINRGTNLFYLLLPTRVVTNTFCSSSIFTSTKPQHRRSTFLSYTSKTNFAESKQIHVHLVVVVIKSRRKTQSFILYYYNELSFMVIDF